MDKKMNLYLNLITQEINIISYILVKILWQNAKTEEEFQSVLLIQKMINKYAEQHNKILEMEDWK